MKIYNTQTKTKEEFKPLDYPNVKIFVCGPTVYDKPHIGHARVYVVFDSFVKFLKHLGYKVFYIQNITDIDDKIINKANKEGVSFKEIAIRYEKEYFEAVKKLRIDSVDKYCRATEHMQEIISQVKRLLEKGFAYETDDGIYFDISKFKEYGKLSGRKEVKEEDAVSRIDESVKKRNKGDFALWKFSKEGEPFWESEFGKGRPGWHIEDTAITEKYFGPQYDIHGGGIDLIFPHHEAELTQMEALSGKSPFVKYWMHLGFLKIRGEKMSKSLGNFITIEDFIEKHGARVLRYFMLKSHYRSPIDFTEDLVFQAKKEIEKLDDFRARLEKVDGNVGGVSLNVKEVENNFVQSLEDDFNTPKAFGVLFDFVNEVNSLMDKGLLSKELSDKVLDFLNNIDTFLGFIYWEEEIPQEIIELVQKREELRRKGEWGEADKIREEIQRRGYTIKDTEKGPIVRKN
ncbi:Cysteine--tRNA ligase [bacterium HR34]|nr:Cysteine--tRNA ligase [bacterium HR34]